MLKAFKFLVNFEQSFFPFQVESQMILLFLLLRRDFPRIYNFFHENFLENEKFVRFFFNQLKIRSKNFHKLCHFMTDGMSFILERLREILSRFEMFDFLFSFLHESTDDERWN